MSAHLKGRKCEGTQAGKKRKAPERTVTDEKVSKKRGKADTSKNLSKTSTHLMSVTSKASWSFGNVGKSWLAVLNDQFNMEYFKQLTAYVDQERKCETVFPPAGDVFSWTSFCDVKDVKVVILGQDPYHDDNQAHGLSFSVKKGVQPPPSLNNMYKELMTDIKAFKSPGHGDLSGWARQGVLLLNAVLTVRAHKPNSHANRGWETLTTAVINWISANLDHVVFLLWGKYAQKKGACIDGNRHLIISSAHPSPLSARNGFFGSRPFSKANSYLTKNSRRPIDWSALL